MAASSSTTDLRDPSQVPFASDSVFNLPLGLNAQWQYNAQLANAPVNVNAGGPWANNIYAGTASDPLVTVTVNGASGGPSGTYQVHIPNGAVPSPDMDSHLAIDDNSSHTWYSFGNFAWTGSGRATATQGGGESDYGSGLQFDHSNWDTAVGTIRESDLQAGTIDHMLRITLPPSMLSSVGDTADQLASYAWPQTAEDGNGPQIYKGTIPFGVTIGIPANA